jgi:hypothetical protein
VGIAAKSRPHLGDESRKARSTPLALIDGQSEEDEHAGTGIVELSLAFDVEELMKACPGWIYFDRGRPVLKESLRVRAVISSRVRLLVRWQEAPGSPA